MPLTAAGGFRVWTHQELTSGSNLGAGVKVRQRSGRLACLWESTEEGEGSPHPCTGHRGHGDAGGFASVHPGPSPVTHPCYPMLFTHCTGLGANKAPRTQEHPGAWVPGAWACPPWQNRAGRKSGSLGCRGNHRAAAAREGGACRRKSRGGFGLSGLFGF